MCTDPHFLVPCCYTWPVIHSISSADSGWTLHARWFLYLGSTLSINVSFIRLFDCINCIKMFSSGWALPILPGESTRGKGRKEDWRRERGGLDRDPQDLWQIAATAFYKWEIITALLLSVERLNVKHLIMLRKINFYKRLLYSSDVFIHNMFCTFLYNNCDDGILFKPVFYRFCRKSDAIHSVWSALQDYVLC